MATVTRSTTVPHDAPRVWDVLADFGAIADWTGFVEHSSLLRGEPLALGTTRRVQAGSVVVLERITRLEAPEVLEYEIDGLPKAVRAAGNRWELVSTAGAGTTVSITTSVTIGSRPPQRLAERVVGRVLASRSDAMLAGLHAHLEHAP